MSQEIEMKMRDKINFQKLEEISLEEIPGGENGELSKANCVLLMVIWTRLPLDQNKDSQRLRTESLKVGDGEDVILTDFGNLVTLHHFFYWDR